MSKSLAIINGDLAIDAGRDFALVSGRQKLLQDLRLWVLEKLGIDPATPTYGNKLDNFREDDRVHQGFIGQLMTADNINNIRIEVINIIQRYQAMQYDKIRSEALRYVGRNTLDEDEVVATIDAVNVRAVGTFAVVQVQLTTLANTPLKLSIPIPEGNTF